MSDEKQTFETILKQAKEAKGLSVIIVDDSSVFTQSGETFLPFHCFDIYSANIQIFQTKKLEGTNNVVVTHSPFPCRYADNVFLYLTMHETYLRNGLLDNESVEFSRIKYGDILTAYSVGIF